MTELQNKEAKIQQILKNKHRQLAIEYNHLIELSLLGLNANLNESEVDYLNHLALLAHHYSKIIYLYTEVEKFKKKLKNIH